MSAKAIFEFSVPTKGGQREFALEAGTSLYFVGANGGGKTRLAVKIESDLGERSHRIAAHRALNLNPSVAKITERQALKGLRLGGTHDNLSLAHRHGNRWHERPATALLNDYDFVVQSLFAEQARTALLSHKNSRAGNATPPKPTKFEKLEEIWDRVMPQRKLKITGDDITVSVPNADDEYPAAEMSDGERATFYLLGQTLAAPPGVLIIFDEPELHIHRSIMGRLWDELEAARPDCGMVVISHDLEFVASRTGGKVVLRDYRPADGWLLEDVPDDSGFSEETATLILGSRRPILFVEGTKSSLDQAIYRACFPTWTVIPRGSCEEVIHAVMTFRANAQLTRIKCAGIVDADAYEAHEQDALAGMRIAILPVSEIENIFLLPDVLKAILKSEGHRGQELDTKAQAILDHVFSEATRPENQLPVVLGYCRRRIDRTLKRLDFSSATDIADLAAEYASETGSLDVPALAALAANKIQAAVALRDAPELLRWFDNKGMLAIAAKAKGTSLLSFEQWILRALRNDAAPALVRTIRRNLPKVSAS